LAARSVRRAATHIVHELGFDLVRAGEEFHGSAAVVPEIYVPGTTVVRASVFATFTDMAAGYLALDAFEPRVPTTLELDVHLHQHPDEFETLHAAARLMKAGRAVMVAMVDFTDETGRSIGFGTASFMPVPDVTMRIPPEHAALRNERRTPGRLRQPFAERAGCVRQSPGVAALARSEDGLNSSKTVNGGLIALAVEEAVLSATPGATVSSLAMRYLRPVRIGPAIATAQVQDGLGRVEVRDGGSDDRLAVYAITRTTDVPATARAGAAA
jgi:acyl-coenzyme A thioesterase PaaI-like protein